MIGRELRTERNHDHSERERTKKKANTTSMFSRKAKNRFSVQVDITSLSAVPYVNGHCYCKLRLLSCGNFEAKTNLKPIQNEIVQWNQNFQFEIKLPENSNIDDAKLRISVRREGAKSEVKIGYVDLQLSQFAEMGRSHQGVLRGYEKTKQRQDNSILKVSIFLSQINKKNHQLKNGRSLGTELDSRLVSSESKESQDTKDPDSTWSRGGQHETWSMGTPVETRSLIGPDKIMPKTVISGYNRPQHSRNSSGASTGYSSSNNSEKTTSGHHRTTTGSNHQRTTSWDYNRSDNQALVDSLFTDLPLKKTT